MSRTTLSARPEEHQTVQPLDEPRHVPAGVPPNVLLVETVVIAKAYVAIAEWHKSSPASSATLSERGWW